MRRALALFVMSAIAIGACSGGSSSTVESTATSGAAAPATSLGAMPTQSESAGDAGPTAGTQGQIKRYQPGDQISVERDGAAWAKVSVTKVSQKAAYGAYDKPRVAGDVFIEAWISYEALADGVDYNPFDWQVFVDETAVDTVTMLIDGPQPELGSGTLPKGRKASGWVVYEVAPKGQVLLSYKGSLFADAPLFDVVLRVK